MSKKLTVIAFFCLFLFVFAPSKSFANTNDFGDSEIFSSDSAKILIKEAKIIIKGEVKSIKLFRGINDVVYTRASVLVSETIKGKIAKKNITVEYRTDEADNLDLLAEESPNLEQGEDVILFLTNSFWRKNIYYIVGGASGKYAVCDDDTVKIGSSCDNKNEAIVIDGESQGAESIISDEEVKAKTPKADEEKQTLDDLLGEIKDAR